MKIYQVGGSVRDMLRGVTPQDYDYIVVGSDMAEMLSLGFIQVGKSFPVFLHPQTKQEYALARKEIKTGRKHTDFRFVFDKSITLEEDLRRRDFTCNALALDTDSNQIFDFFHGQEDIKKNILRHIDDKHFPEDPLRILRLCRFAAQLNYTCAPETIALARKMTTKGMLKDLSHERTWQELEKALKFPDFKNFIATANACGALKKIIPEINTQKLVKKLEAFFSQTCLNNAVVSFALLLHIISQSKTQRNKKQKEDLILKICKELHTPNKYRDFTLTAHRYASVVMKHKSLNSKEYTDLIISTHKKDKVFFDDLSIFYQALAKNDKNLANFPQKTENNHQHFLDLVKVLKSLKAQNMPHFETLSKNKNFGQLFRQYQIDALNRHLKR